MAVAAAVAALAALILGEYELSVVTGAVAGVLVGLAVAETAAAVGRPFPPTLAPVVAALAAAAMVWAGWITVRHRDESIPSEAWVGAAAAAVTAVLRLRGGRSTGSGSPTGP